MENPTQKTMTTDTDIEKSNQRGHQRRLAAKLKAQEEKRTVRVIFKLTPTEDQKLDDLSRGIGRSSYIRAGLFDYPLPQTRGATTEISRDTYIELGRIGRNLNQQTKAINEAVKTGLSPLLAEPYLAKLTDLEAMLKDLRAQLTQTQSAGKGDL